MDKLQTIREYINTYPGSCLANGEPRSYARGYREGFLYAMQIIREMLNESETNNNDKA